MQPIRKRDLSQLRDVQQARRELVDKHDSRHAGFGIRRFIDRQFDVVDIFEIGRDEPDLASGKREDNYESIFRRIRRRSLNALFQLNQRQCIAAILNQTLASDGFDVRRVDALNASNARHGNGKPLAGAVREQQQRLHFGSCGRSFVRLR